MAGKHDQVGRDAEDHAGAGDDAQFGQADEIVETKREERRRRRAAAGDDGHAGVLQRGGDRLARRVRPWPSSSS